MAVKVFGVKIYLQDHAAKVTADAAIGLYNTTSVLAADVDAATNIATISDAGLFTVGDVVTLMAGDGSTPQDNVITVVDGTALTFADNWTNGYLIYDGHLDGNSVFRWIQNSASGVTGWATTMILEDGISGYSRIADYRLGGAVSNPGSCGVTVKNTQKFWKDLVDLGVNLNGMEFRLYEFTDAAQTLKWRGFVEETGYDAVQYQISAKSGDRNKRNTALAKQVNEDDYPNASSSALGQTVPVIFGGSQKVKSLILTESQPILAKSLGFIPYSWLNVNERENDQFVVVSYDTSEGYPRLQIRITENETVGVSGIATILLNKYVEISSGSGANQVRKILEASVASVGTGGACIYLKLSAWLNVAPAANDFVKLYTSTNQIYFESWASIGIVDGLFTFLDDKYYLLNDVAYSLLGTTGAQINNDFSQNGIDSFSAFISIPCTSSISSYSTSLMPGYSGASTTDEGDMQLISGFPGVYSVPALTQGDHRSGNAIDGFTEWQHGPSSHFITYIGLCIEIPKPIVSDEINVTGCYLLLDDTITWDSDTFALIAGATYSFKVIPKYYLGWGTERTVTSFVYNTMTATSFKLQNKYDSTNYYQYLLSTASQIGYVAASLGITSSDQFKRLKSGVISFFYGTHASSSQPDIVTTYTLSQALAHGFLLATDLDYDDIYVDASGRIYNDTWGARKTAASLIENPVDILEHACRLQNWSERSPVPTNGWGYGYASGALIKTTGTGSFDATNLQSLKTLSICEQITDYDKSYTDRLKAAICKAFFLGSYIDENGYECIRLLDPHATAEYTVTMADITDRKKIKVTPAPVDEIYPAPFVKYQKDPATGEAQRIIQFTNTDAAAFSEAYVKAPAGVFTGDDASYYWTKCKALWNKTRQTNEMPSDMSELDFLNGQDADAAAKLYITTLIEWMGAYEIEFPVHYSKASGWKEGTVFTINLPHQTDGSTITCILEEIRVDVNPPYECNIRALIWLEGVEAEYWIQEVMGVFGDDNDWTEVMTTGGAVESITEKK